MGHLPSRLHSARRPRPTKHLSRAARALQIWWHPCFQTRASDWLLSKAALLWWVQGVLFPEAGMVMTEWSTALSSRDRDHDRVL